VAAGPLQRALVRLESRIDGDVVVPDEPRYAAVRTSPWAQYAEVLPAAVVRQQSLHVVVVRRHRGHIERAQTAQSCGKSGCRVATMTGTVAIWREHDAPRLLKHQVGHPYVPYHPAVLGLLSITF
jgi:hypothetical protein